VTGGSAGIGKMIASGSSRRNFSVQSKSLIAFSRFRPKRCESIHRFAEGTPAQGGMFAAHYEQTRLLNALVTLSGCRRDFRWAEERRKSGISVLYSCQCRSEFFFSRLWASFSSQSDDLFSSQKRDAMLSSLNSRSVNPSCMF
jgi:hypothetical protein